MKNHYIVFFLMCILFVGCTSVVERVNQEADSWILDYVSEFNEADEEIYIQKISNAQAADFLKENAPVFGCPDKELEKIWYFRWWTFRKHIKETPEGHVITEFLPQVPWAGRHNAISCPVMHQYSEGRWLKDSRFLDDYSSFWCEEKKLATRYSCPMAYSFLEYFKVKQDTSLIAKSYNSLKDIYFSWYKKRWDSEVGMFWQIDGHDGMEKSISGKLSKDASGYRATINSYMFADALALAQMAQMLGNEDDCIFFRAEADKLKDVVNKRLWDDDARFYKVIPRYGDMSFSPSRELHGYVPWMFCIPDEDRSDAWTQLTDTSGFKAPFGPTSAERRADGFQIAYEGHDCQWNGPGWPFATSQTLTALYRTLHRFGENAHITKDAFFETLGTYAASHRRVREDGKTVCWIDENLNPFTGEWLARKMLMERGNKYNERGKDYNHSTFCDIVISGLVGVNPQLDGSIVIQPLVPEGEWDWFYLSRLYCAGKEISVIYDRTGERFGVRKGLTVYVNGKKAAWSPSYDVTLVI